MAVALAACGDNRVPVAKDARPGDAAIDGVLDAAVLPPCENPVAGAGIRFRRIGKVPVGAALLATAPRGDRRLFVLEQRGTIQIFDEAEQLLPQPFLDLSIDAGGPVVAGGELGLLGLAFHPEYAANGTFYIFYTKLQLPTETLNPYRDVLARCQRSAGDPDRADPASCVEVLSIPDFKSNHNGGMIEFGPDGYLWIGTGDGGGANDPHGNGQAVVDDPVTNQHALLGKLLRIDVDHPAPGKLYGIPADNPIAGSEIYVIGLRNPWRWSFDAATGDLWIGDVGQNAVEELDVLRAGAIAGKNLGWDMWEGSRCAQTTCTMTGFTFPIDERTHAAPPDGDGWAAIIGGQVYRGTCYPDLVGTYLYADNQGRRIVAAKLAADGTLETRDLAPATGEPPLPVGTASIHADARGELYLTSTTGVVYHVEGGPP
ncbi:MAG TPA: PQQ-dependent sugar dehydrogenase [Kofleriaceae bacterium]|nr:PQQ-dependent sugar dehydrogenase [Kofleriaceae bacterium]